MDISNQLAASNEVVMIGNRPAVERPFLRLVGPVVVSAFIASGFMTEAHAQSMGLNGAASPANPISPLHPWNQSSGSADESRVWARSVKWETKPDSAGNPRITPELLEACLAKPDNLDKGNINARSLSAVEQSEAVCNIQWIRFGTQLLAEKRKKSTPGR